MDPEELLGRCKALAGDVSPEPWTVETLPGFFQAFRPEGRDLRGLFADLPRGEALWQRLERVFHYAGESRRPDGARDAYFIVRRPLPVDPERVRVAAQQFLGSMAALAHRENEGRLADLLTTPPEVRVLEGKPPKHPRQTSERAELLRELSGATERIAQRRREPSAVARTIAPAYYFVACDPHLRDYLMWPLYDASGASSLEDAGDPPLRDPFAAYFDLWRHGVKYRIFNNEQIDFYIPRPAG